MVAHIFEGSCVLRIKFKDRQDLNNGHPNISSSKCWILLPLKKFVIQGGN